MTRNNILKAATAVTVTASLLSPTAPAHAHDVDPNYRTDLSTRVVYEIEGSKFGQQTLGYFGGMAIYPLAIVKLFGGAAIFALVIAGIVEGGKAAKAASPT